jgi:Ca2+/Na+ antiporter
VAAPAGRLADPARAFDGVGVIRPRGRLLAWAGGVAAVLGLVNFARAVQNARTFSRGDFYYTLPGEYASRLNPALWNSADMQQAIGYNDGAYFYGPTQYLTLFPIVYLDSYESIARVLLVSHAAVLLAAFAVLWRSLAWRQASPAGAGVALFGAMFLFRPAMQAYVQREFEIVALLLLAVGVALLVRARDSWAAGVFAYLAWFKYWPLVFAGYFVTALRWRACAVYATVSAGVLAVTHLVFGLQHFAIGNTAFIIANMFRPLGSGEELLSPLPDAPYKDAFCRQWVPGRGTQVSIRWAFCGLDDRWPAFPARELFYALVLLLALVIVASGWSMARQRFRPLEMKWAAIWQVSLLTIVGATLLHGHYYYLTLLLLPLLALLYRYLAAPTIPRARLALWAVAYVTLSAFMLPLPVLSSLVQRDAWAMYMDLNLYVFGELLLIALVVFEAADLHWRGTYAHFR